MFFTSGKREKMTTIKRDYIKVISRLAIVSFLVIYFIYFGVLKNESSFKSLCKVGSYATTATAVLWLVWNTWLWRIPCVNAFSSVPDISGRWEGYYKRNGNGSDGKQHAYVLEIQQTFSTIWCTTYQDNQTSSAGIIAELCTLPDKRTSVVFHWAGTRKAEEQNKRLAPNYRGLTSLIYSKAIGEEPAKLEGDYFTDQGTTGYVDVKFVNKNILGRFTVGN